MIKLETIYEGSTFYGAEFELIEEGVAPIIVEGAEVSMHIRRKGDDEPELIYTNANGKLQLESNKIIIPQHIPALTYGKYEFDIKIKFTGGEETVYETGVARGEWEILNPITK